MFMGQLEVRGQQKHDLTNGRMKMAILIVGGFGAQTINSRTAVERMDSFECYEKNFKMKTEEKTVIK